jgi:hypothetical protein
MSPPALLIPACWRSCGQVLWSEPGAASSAQQTLIQTLLVDRGVSFAEAARRFEHEVRPGDDSGFRRSRRPMFGAHMVLLALQKPGAKNMFTLIRPNTGGRGVGH